MTDSPSSSYYYPNKIGRIILESLEEIIGRNGVIAILNQSDMRYLINNYPPNDLNLGFRFEEVSNLQVALEKIYGVRGGRGLALRSGRATFKHGLREFGPLLGFTDLAFRLLPLDEKLRAGAAIFADIFNKYSDQRVVVEEEKDRFYWNIQLCPVCWQRKADVPVCHLAVGLLQEALYWVSGGKFFNVEEIECIAKGDAACRILIEKQPID
ncbi:MAG: 4-vinyl reductase [Anaerolineales bacterium]|nr:4-vinyl reductase [Anaerolineales bacterium]